MNIDKKDLKFGFWFAAGLFLFGAILSVLNRLVHVARNRADGNGGSNGY